MTTSLAGAEFFITESGDVADLVSEIANPSCLLELRVEAVLELAAECAPPRERPSLLLQLVFFVDAQPTVADGRDGAVGHGLLPDLGPLEEKDLARVRHLERGGGRAADLGAQGGGRWRTLGVLP